MCVPYLYMTLPQNKYPLPCHLHSSYPPMVFLIAGYPHIESYSSSVKSYLVCKNSALIISSQCCQCYDWQGWLPQVQSICPQWLHKVQINVPIDYTKCRLNQTHQTGTEVNRHKGRGSLWNLYNLYMAWGNKKLYKIK